MNKDGVGSAYVGDDGKFTCFRYPGSLRSLLEDETQSAKFLAHMPHNGWTIAHMRMGTHGENTYNNTHPFVAGEWCVVHNGVWGDYTGAKLALSKSVRFTGETDSEVAAHVINIIGPKKFALDASGGVYLSLNRDGTLWVSKTSGTLDRLEYNNITLLASDLPNNIKQVRPVPNGWYRYQANGKLASKKEVEEFRYSYGRATNWGGREPIGQDGFPLRSSHPAYSPQPHCTGGAWGQETHVVEGVVVPRDPGVLGADPRDLPRWPGDQGYYGD